MTTLLLSSPFDSPFYSGAPVSTEGELLTQIALGGHPYRIDFSQYQRNTLPIQRQLQDNSSEAGEQTLNTEGAWRRSASNWVFGAGQSHLDDTDSDRRQFYSSLGIDPWTQRQFQLHHDTRSIGAVTTSTPLVLGVPGYLYAARSDELEFSSDPEAGTPTWTSSTIHSGSPVPIRDLTTVGSVVYAALGSSGIRKTSFGATTSSAYSSYQATVLAFVNGFMIGAAGNDISWIDSGGTATTVFTHFDATASFEDIVASPQGAYVACNTQGTAEIYYIGLDSSTGSLLPAVYAGGLPTSETVNCLAYYQGLMLIGTSKGLRLAQIDSAHGLNYGPVVEIPNGVSCFNPRAEFCWFSWRDYDGTHTGTGRVDLSRNTEPGLPAFASDLMAPVQGAVTSVTSFGDKIYFAVASDEIYGQSDDYVTSGTIDSGWIRFGTTERKVAQSLEVRHDPLPDDASVALSLIRDDDTVFPAGVSNIPNSTGPSSPFACGSSNGEELRVVAELTRGTATDETPVVRHWTLRATVSPIRTDEIILPVILHDVINTAEETGSDTYYDTLDEFLYLKDLEAGRSVVTYQEGDHSVDVQVDRVMVRPEKWTTDLTWFNGLVFVRLLTVGA